jgi:nucleolar pre-ribosomal-associated protein 1
MRRKGPIDLTIDPLVKPDIRTLFITFMMHFIQPSTAHSVKSVFLESQRETFLALFKRLGEDPFPLVRLVLETCWTGIWSDQKLRRTTKIGLFSEQTLAQVF